MKYITVAENPILKVMAWVLGAIIGVLFYSFQILKLSGTILKWATTLTANLAKKIEIKKTENTKKNENPSLDHSANATSSV